MRDVRNLNPGSQLLYGGVVRSVFDHRDCTEVDPDPSRGPGVRRYQWVDVRVRLCPTVTLTDPIGDVPRCFGGGGDGRPRCSGQWVGGPQTRFRSAPWGSDPSTLGWVGRCSTTPSLPSWGGRGGEL